MTWTKKSRTSSCRILPTNFTLFCRPSATTICSISSLFGPSPPMIKSTCALAAQIRGIEWINKSAPLRYVSRNKETTTILFGGEIYAENEIWWYQNRNTHLDVSMELNRCNRWHSGWQRSYFHRMKHGDECFLCLCSKRRWHRWHQSERVWATGKWCPISEDNIPPVSKQINYFVCENAACIIKSEEWVVGENGWILHEGTLDNRLVC